MNTKNFELKLPESIRADAERLMAEKPPLELEALTREGMQSLIQELEVHKIELSIQNQQLEEVHRNALESKERYRRLYDSAPTGYLTVDSDGVILEANRAIFRILNVPRNALVGERLSSFISAHCQDRLQIALRELSAGRARKDLLLQTSLPDSDPIDLQVIGVLANEGDTEVSGIQFSLIDVTDLRKMERALQVAVNAVAMAEERERQKLASDLHDDAGQLLVLASIKLEELNDAPASERADRTIELSALLEVIRSRISSLCFQLSPPLLRDVGLVAALEWLTEEMFRNYGLRVKIVEEQEVKLDEDVRIPFYRATRELLLNVVKHAGVKEAAIRITRTGEMARVSVEDAGCGIPPQGKRRGFGLLALRDRLEQLGGSLEIFGNTNRGTTVVASLPTSFRQAFQGGAR
jgi:PAS domain S-box-containing protein